MSAGGAAVSRVVLIGMAGSGKSTVGRGLAEALGGQFVDTDALIAESEERSVSELFATEGETVFRAREADAFRRAVRGPATVVATGGGIVTTAEGRDLLGDARSAGWTVVWLRTNVASLLARIGDGASRPLLAGSPAETVPRLVAEREDLYRRCADLVVDTSDRSVRRVVAAVMESLASSIPDAGAPSQDTM